MASRQLGKLRQWAGEVISARDKTNVSDEFKELERDIELRRLGNWRLHITSSEYQHAVLKKRDSEALLDEKEKLLPIDALGIVMIQHGEEFGDESAYGTSLVSLGKTHCKLAALQETFAMTFEDTFLASIVRTSEEIKEYQKERKKLESRRLSYDAATAKLDKLKGSKKEKEKSEAEDEYERAREKYEESEADVYERMISIQQNEVTQLKDLTALLDLEINSAQQHLEVLKEARNNWIDEDTITQLESTIRTRKPPPPPAPAISTVTIDDSKRVTKTHSKRGSIAGNSSETSSDNEESKQSSSFRARAKSFTRRKSDAGGSKPPSRPPSRPQSRADDRKGRGRSDSNATATTVGDREKDKDSDEGEEKEKEKAPKKMSVTGWASSKVSSIGIGRGKKEKERDREKFAALMDDQDDSSSDEEDGHRSKGEESARSSPTKRPRSKSVSKTKSASTTPNASPKINTRILRRQSTSQTNSPHSSPLHTNPPALKRKFVEALHDYTAGTTDELTFKAGDAILVTNEVLDGWWMGELQNGTGKKGLFPTSYTRTLPQPTTSSSSSSLSMLAPGLMRRKSKSGRKPEKLDGERLIGGSEDDASALGISPIELTPHVISYADSSGYNGPVAASDTEDEQHPFGDHHEATFQSPSDMASSSLRVPTRGNSYAESVDSSEPDIYNDEHDSLMPSSSDSIDRLELSSRSTSKRGNNNLLIPSSVPAPPLPARRLTESGSSTILFVPSPSLLPKKTPPPPPPPRRTQSNTLSIPPPIIPARPNAMRSGSSQSISSGGSSNSFVAVARSTAVTGTPVGPLHLDMKANEELTYSPFDSPRERNTFDLGCREFKQNPFKPKGFCSNCFQIHG